jgi:hypothetical protein
MTRILFIASLFVTQSLSGQVNSLIFQNFGEPIALGKDTFYSSRIHQIILNPDKTFDFWSRRHLSCITWQQYKGVWQQQGDTVVFSDKYGVDEHGVRVTYEKDSRQYFNISVKTDKNSDLKNKTIKLHYVYDYNAHIDDVEKIFTISSDSRIRISFKDIPNFNQLSAIRLEYQLNSNEKRYDYLTQNNPLNYKKSDMPNIIKIEFVEQPKKEIVYRIIRAVREGNTLRIVSTNKTSTTLSDYHPDIEFENGYSLRK